MPTRVRLTTARMQPVQRYSEGVEVEANEEAGQEEEGEERQLTRSPQRELTPKP